MTTVVGDPQVLDRLTELCLALPETIVDDTQPPHRGFRVAKKSFAYYAVDGHDTGSVELGLRTEPRENEALVASDPGRFSLPKYMARFGWVNSRLDLPGRPPNWDELHELVLDSYRIQAPKRLAKLVH